MVGASALISIFVMGAFALFALVRLTDRTTEAGESPTGLREFAAESSHS
jgi:hypothetical protein